MNLSWTAILDLIATSRATLGGFGAGLAVFFLACAAFGIFLPFFTMVTTYLFARRRPKPLDLSKPLPKVSIIKACYAADDGEELNFVEWFEQDYPGQFELLFVVSQETDPIVPLVRRFQARYPAVISRLVISKTRRAFWKKVDALYDGHLAATGDVIIYSDSDTIVRRDYLRSMVSVLQDPNVHMVSTPQYDTGITGFGTALKVMGNNLDLAQFPMNGDFFMELFRRRNKYGFGQSIGFRKAEFDAFGAEAWEIIFKFLADDMALPYVFWKNGKNVKQFYIYCPVRFSNKSFKDVMKQKLRWVNCQKLAIGNPYVYVSGMFFYPIVPSFFLALTSGFHPTAVSLMVVSAIARMMGTAWFELQMLGSLKQSLRWAWVMPIWDIIQVPFFIYGFVNSKIMFDGVEYKVVDRYFMEKVELDPERAAQLAGRRHK